VTRETDVAVVGGGLTGLACAAGLAEAGHEVLVLDRAPASGAKAHGALVPALDPEGPLAEVAGSLDEAPTGRRLEGARLHAVSRSRSAGVPLDVDAGPGRPWARAARREALVGWLGDRVHEALREDGGGIVPGAHGARLVREDGRVVGVEADGIEPVRADMVVAADGPTSALARQVSAVPEDPADWLLRTEVRFEAPPAAVDEAFGLPDGEPAARFLAGAPFEEAPGSGHVLAGDGAVHVGATGRLDAFLEGRDQPGELLDRVVEHPLAQSLLPEAAGETRYAATVLPAEPGEAEGHEGLVCLGAAAGHIRVRGPIVDELSAGLEQSRRLAQAAREAGDLREAAKRAHPTRHRAGPGGASPSGLQASVAEGRGPVGGLVAGVATSGVGRSLLGTGWGRARVEAAVNDPDWARAGQGARFASVTVPTLLAEEDGERLPEPAATVEPRSMDQRLDEAAFDPPEAPHLALDDDGEDAAGGLVHACPAGGPDVARGALRFEAAGPGVREERFVAAEPYACLECGACRLAEAAVYEHPPDGRGVRFDEAHADDDP
jgi:electron transfer flavoprotein-quinone oxidoreductase